MKEQLTKLENEQNELMNQIETMKKESENMTKENEELKKTIEDNKMKITQLDTETNKHLETIKSLTERNKKVESNSKAKIIK